MTHLPFSDATQLVRDAESIAVIGHIRPDADAIGSVTAVVQALEQLGKSATGWIGQREAFATNLLTIPHADEIRCAVSLPKADLYVVVDCGSPDRTGGMTAALSSSSKPVIMVDHHASNQGFGTVNLLDHQAESTSTIIRQWLDDLGVSLTRQLAHSLYAGLVTDTGNFRWGRPHMHALAQELVECGLDTRLIAGQLMDDVSLDALKMVGTVLSRIQVKTAGEYAVAILTGEHELISPFDTSEVEGLVDYVRGVDTADVSAVFKEYRPGWFAVSLRTTKDIDVSRIAGVLGGGGHLRAAGYTTEGSVEQAHRQLLDAIIAVNG